MSIRKCVLLVLSLGAYSFLSFGAYGKDDQPPLLEKVLEGGIAIDVPSDTTLVEESPVEDFILYTLNDKSGKRLLVVYVGNHPQPGSVPRNADTSTEKIGGFTARSSEWSNASGLRSGSVTVQLHPSSGWPERAQLTYSLLSDTEAKLVASVISSLHPSEAASR